MTPADITRSRFRVDDSEQEECNTIVSHSKNAANQRERREERESRAKVILSKFFLT
jgi:hypothetical protein